MFLSLGHRSSGAAPRRLALLLGLLLAGCTTVGPDFEAPTAAAPEDWASWRSADPSLQLPTEGTPALLQADWWRLFDDPVLDRLQARAVEANPDLRTAALRFVQARVQRDTVTAQQVPEVGVSGGINRQRLSERGAGLRSLSAIGGDNAAALTERLAEPFTLYQAGFDASWEPDLWGRVRRSVEAADADVAEQQALLTLARQSLASELARQYVGLRTTQRQIGLLHEDIALLQQRLSLLQVQVQRGLADHLPLDSQRAELAGLQARLPGLLAEEGAAINRIGLLLGEPPGALRQTLVGAVPAREGAGRPGQVPQPDGNAPASGVAGPTIAALPDLSLGLPSEVAQRRPDIRAAEARLHRATARIGVARAELYPSIRLGAHFGYESYLQGELADWGSRSWSIGPSLSLPLFDRGRRRRTVQLRELEQQQAAIAYHQTVREAWQEIDDALSAYAATRQQLTQLRERLDRTADAERLAWARYRGGSSDFLTVLDSQRQHLQARRDLVTAEGELQTRFAHLHKALATPTPANTAATATTTPAATATP